MSAPHDQLRDPSNQREPTSSFYPAIDHRRMSDPALSDSHPSAYRPLDSRYNYASSTAYSPPSLHYPASSRPTYAINSRTDGNASTDYQSRQTHDDAFPDPSDNSPRPSTDSTGAVDSNFHIQSLSSRSSVSPDIPTQPSDEDQNPSFRSDSSRTYAFVSLPGTTIRKRPRRRYDEIERLYHCSWPDCTKAYSTLNHLNAHVMMQKHGLMRLSSEFKGLNSTDT